jgi:hypothetical protein
MFLVVYFSIQMCLGLIFPHFLVLLFFWKTQNYKKIEKISKIIKIYFIKKFNFQVLGTFRWNKLERKTKFDLKLAIVTIEWNWPKHWPIMCFFPWTFFLASAFWNSPIWVKMDNKMAIWQPCLSQSNKSFQFS